MSVKNPLPAQENGLEIKHYRAGFSLFLISQGVVFLVLIAVRYLIAGSTVGPYSQWLGAAVTVVILWSAIQAKRANLAADQGNHEAILKRLHGAFWLGVLAFLLVVLTWVGVRAGGYPVKMPSLEVFWVATGFWLVYVLLGLFVLFAARSRGMRVGYSPASHWDLEASSRFWSLVALGWVALWIAFFLI